MEGEQIEPYLAFSSSHDGSGSIKICMTPVRVVCQNTLNLAIASTEGLAYTDWLEYRRMGIGGSDTSVVCSINRYKSPIELWMEKTGQMPYQEAGEAAYWGSRLESLVKDEFTSRTGIEVIQVNQILQSVDHPFMIANLDGTCMHPNYGTCVFEAKTAMAFKYSFRYERIYTRGISVVYVSDLSIYGFQKFNNRNPHDNREPFFIAQVTQVLEFIYIAMG